MVTTERVGFVRWAPGVSCWTLPTLRVTHPGLPNPAWFKETTAGFCGCPWRGHVESLTALMRVHSAATGGLDPQIRPLPWVPEAGWWACAVSLGVSRSRPVGFGSGLVRAGQAIAPETSWRSLVATRQCLVVAHEHLCGTVWRLGAVPCGGYLWIPSIRINSHDCSWRFPGAFVRKRGKKIKVRTYRSHVVILGESIPTIGIKRHISGEKRGKAHIENKPTVVLLMHPFGAGMDPQLWMGAAVQNL